MYGTVMHKLYGKIPDVRQGARRALQGLPAHSEGPDAETAVHVIKGRAGVEILRSLLPQ